MEKIKPTGATAGEIQKGESMQDKDNDFPFDIPEGTDSCGRGCCTPEKSVCISFRRLARAA